MKLGPIEIKFKRIKKMNWREAVNEVNKRTDVVEAENRAMLQRLKNIETVMMSITQAMDRLSKRK